MTAFQVEVARLFFSLPAAQGFLLAGGAALVAQHLTTRPTQDLDFFTRVGGTSVPTARDALEVAAHEQGWSIERIRDEPTFCRLIVLAQMLRDLTRFSDQDLPTPEERIPTTMRDFFAAWAKELDDITASTTG